MTDIVERLRSSAPLPLCPFEKRSPEYWTTPNDKPCKFCGGLPEGPDKCTGADMRIMLEAADEIDKQRALIETQQAALKALDDWWTEEFPGGPDDPKNSKGFIVLSDDTLDLWRKIRAALAAAKEITQ